MSTEKIPEETFSNPPLLTKLRSLSSLLEWCHLASGFCLSSDCEILTILSISSFPLFTWANPIHTWTQSIPTQGFWALILHPLTTTGTDWDNFYFTSRIQPRHHNTRCLPHYHLLPIQTQLANASQISQTPCTSLSWHLRQLMLTGGLAGLRITMCCVTFPGETWTDVWLF